MVFSFANAALFWLWMPHDTSGTGPSYAFTEVGAKSSGGFSSFGAPPEGGISPVEAVPTTSGAVGGGYQGFGSATL